ncbi:hypothetical protein EY643_02255 [Halioglobus maricola]|uniref:Uncharacterized protein n=1 Tax=Halioglobus maricola TaxID=2601894 RepID=A0A5P9NG92_9GAMM|nr:hypothetical protein [Halioglobus maricola]QFU74566.1 hypothetical protein EY643_02255 [Halioglobus maricola]
MKIWLALLVLLPASVLAQEQVEEESEAVVPATEVVPVLRDTPVPEATTDDEELPETWVDASHTTAADSAQALVEWMDDFFGDPTYDLEKAESFLRLEFENEWDQDDGNDFGVRLRGKVQLPKISQRANLLFNDDDTDSNDREERADQDNISLQVNVRESKRSRLDGTLSWSDGAPKPGVRFRNEGDIREGRSYRYVQRVQWANDEQFFTLGQVDLYQALENEHVIRWSNRMKWGEETDGVEWRTRLSLFQRFGETTKRPLALNHFVTVRGETKPKSYIQNYTLGTLWRRQVYRDFLFFEVEPTLNYRQPEYDEERQVAWQIMLRMEIHLAKDFARKKKKKD